MPISAKDSMRVKAGEKRHREWKKYVQTPPHNPKDKDGNLKRCRHERKPVEFVPEVVDVDKAIRSGGVVPDVTMRSADSKFAAMHREFSGQIMQGKVVISTGIIVHSYKPGQDDVAERVDIAPHVHGSVQKVGRSLEEAARDEGMGRLGAIIGKGKDYVPSPVAKARPDSPFKRSGKSPFTVVYKK
jgi:hypothetical protein